MNENTTIQVKGRPVRVSGCRINGQQVIATGKLVTIAGIMDEEFLEGETVADPVDFVAQLKRAKFSADIFTFAQKLPDVAPKYPYHLQWENFAAIPITTFTDWLDNRVERDVRKAVNRAKKLGVVVKVSEFDDAFVAGICRIYNESPVRQGKPFWHYQKDLETIKRDNSVHQERSTCLGAYYDGELIGFIRMLTVGRTAMTTQVISMMKHSDKKPTNALIAKAVEVCEQNKLSHLVYSRFMYNNVYSSLTEFKRRNGFEQVLVPRYYVPLTTKGIVALKLGLHLPVSTWVPAPVFAKLREVRSAWNRPKLKSSKAPS